MCVACNPGVLSVLRHTVSRRTFLSVSGGAAVGAMGGRVCAAQPAGPRTTVFRGGTVLTMGGPAPRAEAVAVRDGRILAVGTSEDVMTRAGSGAAIVDLKGRTLLPGLIDPHMHMIFVALEDWVDVGAISVPDFSGVERRVREAAAKAPAGEWVRAQLFDPSITRGAAIPTVAMLDDWVPNNPFFVLESNGHVAYVNSLALQRAGVTGDTPDPPLARFVRDANGALTGRLEEVSAMVPFFRTMTPVSGREMAVRLRRLLDHTSSVGCTSLHDCGIGMQGGMSDLEVLDAVMADNPPVRYRGMLVTTAMESWEKAGLRPGRGNDLYKIDGMKAWADGSNQAYTGYQRTDYLGKQSRGSLNYTLEQLTDAIWKAHEGGWQVGVHANGDAAIDTVLQAYDSVLKASPRVDHRHRIEHCSVLHPDQMAKMRALELSPTFLIGHVRWWGKAFRDRILGPEQSKFYDPCASALAAGLRISLHSDWNVTPIQPLRCVDDAVSRIMNEGGDIFFPNERIPVEAALRAVTIDAAWQCRMDDIVGSIEPGKYADFAILEDDPTKPSPRRIADIKVSETWLAGMKRFG